MSRTSLVSSIRMKTSGIRTVMTAKATAKSRLSIFPKKGKKRAETFLPAAPGADHAVGVGQNQGLGIKHSMSGTTIKDEQSVHFVAQRPTQQFNNKRKEDINLKQDVMLASFFQLLFELVDNFDRSEEIEKLRRQRILQELKIAPKASEFEEVRACEP